MITVAICTYNRADLLRKTLECIVSSLTIPQGLDWELVIVDNNSTDDTASVVAEFKDHLPIRAVAEAQQGLAYARNRAVEEARGDYIIWTDDDVLVDPGWLASYVLAFQTWPEEAFFGGPIVPCFLCETPRWLDDAWARVSAAYSVLDLGNEPIPLSTTRVPYGANMAFRTDAQREYPYDVALGHSGTEKVGGEETQLIRAMIRGGARGRWVPDARVRHLIPAERLTIEFLRAHYVGRGIRRTIDRPTSRRSAQIWALRGMAGTVRYHLGKLLGVPAIWARGLRTASIARGVLEGAARSGANLTEVRPEVRR